MIRTSHILAASMVALLTTAVASSAQGTPPSTTHVVELVTNAGSPPYQFAPSTVVARQGDTLRFVEAAGVMHNVHFTAHPAGAKLGSATVGPYLSAKGEVYQVVIDARFTPGKYTFICDPHEALGMSGTLIVEPKPAPSGPVN